MAETALGGALPAGDANGLDALAAGFITEPHKLRAILVLVDCAKIVQKTDSGEKIAVARVRRIEAILPEDFGAAERLIRRSLEKRTGQTVLPLDLEDDLRAAFADFDATADPDDAAEAAEPDTLFADDAEPTSDTAEPAAEPPEPPAKPRRGRPRKQVAAEPEPEPEQPAEPDPDRAEPEADPDRADPNDAEPWDDDPRNDPTEG